MSNELSELLRSVIKEELEPVSRQLAELKTDQQEMKQEQQSMKQDLQEMKQEQQSMKQDLLEVKQEQQTMKQDLDMIKRAVLETNDRLKNVETILGNQHQIIELLSARSIQQEAELRRIK